MTEEQGLLQVVALYSESVHVKPRMEDVTFLQLTPTELATVAAGLSGLMVLAAFVSHRPVIAELMRKVTDCIMVQHGDVNDDAEEWE